MTAGEILIKINDEGRIDILAQWREGVTLNIKNMEDLERLRDRSKVFISQQKLDQNDAGDILKNNQVKGFEKVLR